MAKIKTLNETNTNDKDVTKKLTEEIEMIKLRNPDGYVNDFMQIATHYS